MALKSGNSGDLSTSNKYIKYRIYIDETATSTTGNYSTVRVRVWLYRTNTGYTTYGSGTVYCTINGTLHTDTLSSSDKITNSGLWVLDTTVSVPHNDDGSYTLKVSAYITHSQFTSSSQSYSLALTNILRASTLTVSNGTLGLNQTVTINRASSNFRHTLTWACGGSSGTLATTSDSGTSFILNCPTSIADKYPSVTSVTCTLTIVTYSGSTKVGTKSYSVSMTIPGSPSISSLSISDTATKPSAMTGYYQNISKLKAVVTPTLNYSSPIASYKITMAGKTYTTATATMSDVITLTGNVTITATVTDKRGKSASKSTTVTVLAYTLPSVSSVSAYRCNSESDTTENLLGNYAQVSYAVSIAELSGNTGTITISYTGKDGSSGSKVSGTTISSSNSYSITESTVIPASTDYSHSVTVTVEDLFGNTASKTIGVTTGAPIMEWYNGARGISFGKTAETPYLLDSGWNIKTSKRFYSTDPSGLSGLWGGTGLSGEDLPLIYRNQNVVDDEENISKVGNCVINFNSTPGNSGHLTMYGKNIYMGSSVAPITKRYENGSMIGQFITSYVTPNTSLTTNDTWYETTTITLSPGVYIVTAYGQFSNTGSAGIRDIRIYNKTASTAFLESASSTYTPSNLIMMHTSATIAVSDSTVISLQCKRRSSETTVPKVEVAYLKAVRFLGYFPS